MASFSAELKGMNEAIEVLQVLTDRLKDSEGFYKEIGEETIKEIHKSFLRSESPNGDRWAPLKKKRPDGSSKPLVTTNPVLSRSFRIIRLSKTTVVIGTPVSYARWHQEGTDDIPRRAFLPFTNDGSLIVTKPLQGIINRAMDRWFGKFDKKYSGG